MAKSKKAKGLSLSIDKPDKKETKLTDSTVSTDIVMMNIKVTKEWRKELKQLALDEDKTMSDIIREGIELYKKHNT